MLLEHPALKLSIGVQDILEVIEAVLREKNWRKFELMNFKLVYTPIYVFNYDILMEQDVQGQTYSQGMSGNMALNALTSKLEPVLTEIMEKQPVDYEKEISHDFDYDLEKSAITKEELHETCKIKLAGQYNVGKESVATSGFRIVYWPIWRVFVTMPKRIQRIQVDAVSGQTLNIEEVPEKEKSWIEVTQDTVEKMKTPQGWMELTKQAADLTAKGIKATAHVASKSSAKAADGAAGSNFMNWLFHTKNGMYTLVGMLLLIVVLILL